MSGRLPPNSRILPDFAVPIFSISIEIFPQIFKIGFYGNVFDFGFFGKGVKPYFSVDPIREKVKLALG